MAETNVPDDLPITADDAAYGALSGVLADQEVYLAPEQRREICDEVLRFVQPIIAARALRDAADDADQRVGTTTNDLAFADDEMFVRLDWLRQRADRMEAQP